MPANAGPKERKKLYMSNFASIVVDQLNAGQKPSHTYHRVHKFGGGGAQINMCKDGSAFMTFVYQESCTVDEYNDSVHPDEQISLISNLRDWLIYNDFDVRDYDRTNLSDSSYLAVLDCDLNKTNLILV
jgi:hypothetical protein